MSAVERLEAAIAELEKLSAEATPGPWTAWKRRDHHSWLSYGVEDHRGDDIVTAFRSDDVELIEVLYRTIGPQLVILRNALAQSDGSPDEPGSVEDALALAAVILGSES